MQKFLLMMLVLGGVVNGIAGFTSGSTPTTAIECLWIVNDLTLILGLIGLLLVHAAQLNTIGYIGLLLCITSLAFIAGPSAQIGGIPAYSIGTPLIALGFLLVAIGSWLSGVIKPHLSAMLAVSVLLSVGTAVVGICRLTVTANLIFSLAIILVALDSLGKSNHRENYVS